MIEKSLVSYHSRPLDGLHVFYFKIQTLLHPKIGETEVSRNILTLRTYSNFNIHSSWTGTSTLRQSLFICLQNVTTPIVPNTEEIDHGISLEKCYGNCSL
jgi:hypothetical protein